MIIFIPVWVFWALGGAALLVAGTHIEATARS